jgi:nitroreductase
MNMLNAIHALGYGGKWVTGAACYDPRVAGALGIIPPDRLMGFIRVGTPKEPPPAARRPERGAHVHEWTRPICSVQ